MKNAWDEWDIEINHMWHMTCRGKVGEYLRETRSTCGKYKY